MWINGLNVEKGRKKNKNEMSVLVIKNVIKHNSISMNKYIIVAHTYNVFKMQQLAEHR